MYVIVRNGLFYSRKKVYKMMDIREHPKVVYLYERLVRNAEWFDSKLEANKVCKEVNGQQVIQLSEAARRRLLLIKRNRKGE
jgi:hypothetical protein